MQALLDSDLRVTQLHAYNNVSGMLTLILANGSTATARRPGDRVFGFTLRGFLSKNTTPTTHPNPSPFSSATPARSHGITTTTTTTIANEAEVLAVLEYDSSRWGLIAFLGPTGRLGPSGVSGGKTQIHERRRGRLEVWRRRGRY